MFLFVHFDLASVVFFENDTYYGFECKKKHADALKSDLGSRKKIWGEQRI